MNEALVSLVKVHTAMYLRNVELIDEVRKLEGKLIAERQEVSAHERRVIQLRVKLEEAEQRLSARAQEHQDWARQEADLMGEIAAKERRIEEIDANREIAEKMCKAAQDDLKAFLEKMADKNAEIKKLKNDVQRLEGELDDAR